MYSVLLVIILIIILFWCILLANSELLSPAIIFCLSFLFCSIWAAVYADSWDFIMGETTLYVVSGGVLEFALVSFIVKSYMRHYSNHNVVLASPTSEYSQTFESIELGKPLTIAFIVFEIAALTYTVYEILGAAGTSNLSKALVYFNNTTKFTTDVVVFRHSGLLHLLWDMLDALGFWITYVISYKTLLKKKPYGEVVILVLSISSNFLRGARTTAIYKILALICIYFMLSKRINGKKITIKSIVYFFAIILAFIGFLYSFKYIGTLMGRTITQSGMDYVALYCGSEIANLDAFLKEGWGGIDTIFDTQSLYGLFYYVRPLFGFTEKVLQVLPARRLGGVVLSNVYTTFYQYIYDFGYLGEIVFVAIMAIASQISYEYARLAKLANKVPMSVIIYSFIFTTLALSFFSNKFYERVVTVPFVYDIIIWVILNWLVSHFGPNKDRSQAQFL